MAAGCPAKGQRIEAQHLGRYEMFAHSNEDLKRFVVGGLGAALFGITCLLAAVGPAQMTAPGQLATSVQPAATLQS